MVSAQRILPALLVALGLVACQPAGDRTTLSMSIGRSSQYVMTDGVSIRHFIIDVDCLNGLTETITGDVDDDGNFEVDAPRCLQAQIVFKGLVEDGSPALQGTTRVVIHPPVTDVNIDVVRVGTVNFLNEDTNSTVCSVSTAVDSTFGAFSARFRLDQNQTYTAVLPVNGATLTCLPLADCADVATCVLEGTRAITKQVAPPFGSSTTLSLQDLTRALVFVIEPALNLLAGETWPTISVQLVDELGQVIATQNTGSAVLTTVSATTHGGFNNASAPFVNGVATFETASFLTAGSIALVVSADIDGVRLTTDPRSVVVGAAAPAVLAFDSVPAVVFAGQQFEATVSGTDAFGNATSPSALLLTSNDTQAIPQRFLDGVSALTYTFFTAGQQTLIARDVANPAVSATASVRVDPAMGNAIELQAPSAVASSALFTATVVVRDNWSNIASLYTGTMTVASSPPGVVQGVTTYAYQAQDAGVHAFDTLFIGATSGTYALSATDGSRTSSAATIRVVPTGEIASFRFTVAATAVNHQATNVTVQALDASGNPMTTGPHASDYVTLQSTDSAASSTSNYLSAGAATFSYTFVTVGTQTLSVNAGGVIHAGPAVNVTAGFPYAYTFVTQPPATVIAGTPFSAAVQMNDPYGNLIPASSYTAVLALSPTAALTGGTTETKAGAIDAFNSLVVSTPGTYSLTATFSNGTPSGFGSNNFTVNVPGCPKAYVSTSGKATNSGCSESSPVDSIGRAATLVDASGTIYVTKGPFTETLTFNKGLNFTITGGYDLSFKGSSFSTPTVIVGGEDALQTIECTESSIITLDNVVVKGASIVSKNSGVQHSALLADGGCTLTVQNSRIEGTFVAQNIPVAAIAITDAKQVILVNNFIHSGNRDKAQSIQSLYGVNISGTGGAGVSIVNNTIYVPVAVEAHSACVTISSTDAVATLTNNILVGDFTNCTLSGGTCSGYENGANFASAQNNVVLNVQKGGTANYIAYDTTKGQSPPLLASINAHPLGRPRYVDNGVAADEVLSSGHFIDFGGKDGIIDTIEDNNWHLSYDNNIRIGKAPGGSDCGSGGKSKCNGRADDIDGEKRASVPVCDGADEIAASAATKLQTTL